MFCGLDALDSCKVLQSESRSTLLAEHQTLSDITPVIPSLVSLLEPTSGPSPAFDESLFVPASDALQELMAHPPFYDGSGSKTLTEPLLIWIEKWGGVIVGASIQSEIAIPHDDCDADQPNRRIRGSRFSFFLQTPCRVGRAVYIVLRYKHYVKDNGFSLGVYQIISGSSVSARTFIVHRTARIRRPRRRRERDDVGILVPVPGVALDGRLPPRLR